MKLLFSKHWNVGIALVLSTVWLVSCMGTAKVTHPTAAPQPITTPPPTLIPPECFGLYVEMQDRYTGTSLDSTYLVSPDGGSPKQRIYQFNAGEPIVATAILLIFGKGELKVPGGINSENYQMKLLNSHGQTLEMTEEGKVALGEGRLRSGWTMDQSSPQLQSFPLDEWYDFSAGDYTLAVTRTVFFDGKLYPVRGNLVSFTVR